MFNHILRNIGTTTRSIQSLCDTKYRSLNLQKGQFIFLMRICEHPSINLRDLSQMISVEKSTTTRAIQKLEADGYIYRRNNLNDGRFFDLYPTDKGLSIYPELARYELQLLKTFSANLSETELELLNKIFSSFNQTVHLTSSEVLPTQNQDGKLSIQLANTPDLLKNCYYVREQVFQIGQNVCAELDFDGKDADAFNFGAYFDDVIAGTMRLRPISEKTIKFERLAVLPDFRRLSIASAMIEYAIVFAKSNGFRSMQLHAQIKAIPLYERAGFIAVGDRFYEAGIEHLKMERVLDLFDC